MRPAVNHISRAAQYSLTAKSVCRGFLLRWLDRLIALRERCTLVPLLGNHEEMALTARSDLEAVEAWLGCGGQATLDSYGSGGGLEMIPLEHWRFLAARGKVPQVEVPQPGSGVNPEFLGQHLAGPAAGSQGVRLPVTAIQRQHQAGPPPLVQWVAERRARQEKQ